ncbi:MAG TPA: FHA domain-containing protein [Syntrophobacteria bacterium]|nr:FHA domain-containing protein [Syntrophobacteria bacterium]
MVTEGGILDATSHWRRLSGRLVSLYQQGWYSEAASLAEELLDVAEKHFEPSDPRMVESLNNLALVYYAQAKDVESTIFEQTLATTKVQALWPEHAVTSGSLHKLVLINLAGRKYSRAEALLRRALTLVEESRGPESDLRPHILGNLAELYSSQGKYTEAESLLRSIRAEVPMVEKGDGTPADDGPSLELAPSLNNREFMRISSHLPAELSTGTVGVKVTGMTENLSQVGAFIKTKEWYKFAVNDEVSVCITLPSLLSPHGVPTSVEGTGLIARIDPVNEGVGVHFSRSINRFKRIGKVQIPGKIKYKKLAQYVPHLDETGLKEFSAHNAYGFFVESIRFFLDKNVIFQFSTEIIDAQSLIDLDKNQHIPLDLLEARVIELSIKDTNEYVDVIKIGRSPSNDVVLYNKLISKSHAFLYYPMHDKSPFLVDLGSRNATFVNGTKITPYEMHQLADADEISFGPETKVTYLSPKAFHEFLVAVRESSRTLSKPR